MRWNVTQIAPAGYVHARALDEICEYLAAMLRALDLEIARTTNHIDVDTTNVVVGGHLLADAHVDALPAGTILFNSEQLAESQPAPYLRALAAHRVWDYSAANIRHAAHARVVPFGHCVQVARPRVRSPGDALVFHGSITPHREAALRDLRAAGARVETVFGEYGAERDARMFGARAVLNLHKHAHTEAFEVIRCWYALNSGVPVVSEDTADPTADAFRDHMTFGSPSELAAAPLRRPQLPSRLAELATLVRR